MKAPSLGGWGPALLALALASVQTALLARTAWDKSDTADEASYLGSAALQWTHHDFTTIRHAPVPKWGFALGMRIADPTIAQAPIDRSLTPERAAFGYRNPAYFMLWHRPLDEMRRNLFAARMATIVITVLSGLLLWTTARRFGELAAFFAHALWSFSPTVLANGSLATLDMWVAASMVLALWASARYLERPGLRWAVLAGIAFGLGLGTKVFVLGALPVMLAVWGVGLARTRRAEGRPWRWELGRHALTVGAVTILTLWAAHLCAVGDASNQPLVARLGWKPRTFGPLPFPTWIEGLFLQIALGPVGRRNYLFGQMSKNGWWWFYLACLAFKVTVGAQVLALLRTIALVRVRLPRPRLEIDAALLAFPALLFVVMSLGNTQAGIRYMLPAFPFAILWLCQVAGDARAGFGRIGAALAWIALAAGTAESLAVHPHHLMFFNVWAGGPEGGPRYLIQGDDWGQDQRRLGEWQKRTGIAGIFYTPYSGEPRSWGVNYKKPPCTPKRGVYALHAAEVHRPKLTDPGCLDWLTVEPPDERIGYSIYIYYVDKERIERLKSERWNPHPFFRSGPASPPTSPTPPPEEGPESPAGEPPPPAESAEPPNP